MDGSTNAILFGPSSKILWIKLDWIGLDEEEPVKFFEIHQDEDHTYIWETVYIHKFKDVTNYTHYISYRINKLINSQLMLTSKQFSFSVNAA